jgi:phosphoribosylglycinamide formyltransferase-1
VKRVAILISGGGSNMVKLCEDMHGDHPARPVLVASNDPDAGGLKKAQDMGIATAAVNHASFGSRHDFEAELLKSLNTASPDLICLAGFMRILTPEFVAQFEGRMLNIHPSLLPKYPGLHTHQRALDAGDAQAGCSVHEVTSVLDDGPVFGQAKVEVAPDDTAETLAARVLEQEHRLYPAVLRRICAGDRSYLAMT